MTPIKTLWGQGGLMYHWPQIIQDVAKPWFLSCLPPTPILPNASQDHLLPGLRASLLEWPWPPYLKIGHVPGWSHFCPVLKVQSPFIFSKDSTFLSTFLRYGGYLQGPHLFLPHVGILDLEQGKHWLSLLAFSLSLRSWALKFWISETLSSF